jgi:prevent-host-death family protein
MYLIFNEKILAMSKKQISIAEARSHLAAVVGEVEKGSPVELTRRGKAVAVLLSVADYERLSNRSMSFVEACEKYRT